MKVITNGSIHIGDFKLNIPSLSIGNSCTHITGPNGAGKSTLLKALLMLYPFKSGTISQDPRWRHGYVPQNYQQSLFPWMSARDNLLLHNEENDPETLESLFFTGFEESDLSKRVFHLSGGQCQRICVVREACAGFDWLILDEPFSGIDTKSVPLLGQVLARMIKKGTKVVLTSHTDLPDNLISLPGFNEITIERDSDCTAIVVGNEK